MANASLALGAGTGACIVECHSYVVTALIGEKDYFIGTRASESRVTLNNTSPCLGQNFKNTWTKQQFQRFCLSNLKEALAI